MLNTKASVQLLNESVIPDYSLTVYMGIQSDSGPEGFMLLEDVNDLYRYYNTYSESQSYNMAEFCLLRGYRVLAHSVGVITGPASQRKFIVGSSSFFFSPREGVDYSKPSPTPFQSSASEALYSQILTFNDVEDIGSTPIISFALIVPKKVYLGNGSIQNLIVPLSIGISRADLSDRYAIDSDLGLFLESGSVTVSDFKDVVLDFLVRQCNLSVELLPNTDNRYLVSSQTELSDFIIMNPITPLGSTMIESQISDLGRSDNYCRRFDSNKVCTITTKILSSLDDTTVDIVNSDGYYYVNIYRYDVSGIQVISESFQYSTDPTSPSYISKLSLDSRLVDIDIHDETKDVSGVYELVGQEVFITDLDFYKSELEEGSYQADICVDNSPDVDLYYRSGYISKLREAFPTSLIFTDFMPRSNENVVQVGPDVTWLDSGFRLKGVSYLLHLLPVHNMGSDTYDLRVEEGTEGITYENEIEEGDYGLTLIGVKTGNLPVKSKLSVLAMENYIINRTVKTTEEFRSLILEAQNIVNNYLGTDTQVEIEVLSLVYNKLTAKLVFRVDTYIIYSFSITTTLLW